MVGGGPAGSATALRLARAGIGVTLIERAAFPRRKVCGEYQNCGAVEALDDLGLRGLVQAAGTELQGIRLIPPHAPAVELRFSRAALSCDRATLDAIVLTAARNAGVNVVRGRVESLVFDGRRVTGVMYRDATGEAVHARSRIVVGADGTTSVVARKLGLTLPLRPKRRFAVGGHYRGFGDLNGFIEMYVGDGAYFAINPLDAGRANVMVVVPQAALAGWSADIDRGIAGRAAELGRGRRSFAHAERIGNRVSAGPLAHRVCAPVAPGALLVGDAAGFLNPFTGQGVYLALAGAREASAAIVQAFADRSAEDRAFQRYAAARQTDFRRRAVLCALVASLIDCSPLARRTAERLNRHAHARRTLVDAICGIGSPQSGYTPALLGRLLA